MSAAADVTERSSLDREWWLRTVTFLLRPRSVFEALRDDSAEAADARQEPMLAIIFLGGIAGLLATGAAGRLLDPPSAYDGLLIAIWAFIAGGIYGAASYFLGGAALYLGQHGAGGSASYRQARHVLAFSALPLIVWLVLVWPIRLALYGEDLFRSGGSDAGTDRIVFGAISGLFVAWAITLLAVGVRTVYRWDWRRCANALAFTLVAFVAFAFAAAIILRGA